VSALIWPDSNVSMSSVAVSYWVAPLGDSKLIVTKYSERLDEWLVTVTGTVA
jgi:hypothetical protein